MELFDEFESDPDVYDKAKLFWNELLQPIVDLRGWLEPWFPQVLRGPDLYGDGIFSARYPTSRKGFIVNQRSAKSASSSFASYTDIWDPDYEALDVVHVQTVLAVRNIPRVYQVFEIWSDPSIVRSHMESLLAEGEKAGWPPDWASRSRT